MRVAVAACAFGLLVVSALPVRAEVTVRVKAGRVDLTARAAPLSEVLRRLAEQTGMKVVYEGAEPRELVTASLAGRSPVEAVNELLKDRGLNYALAVHATGRVETLIIVTAVRPPATQERARAATPAEPSTPPAPAVESLVDLLEQVGSPVGEKLRAAEAAAEQEAAVPLPDLLERLSEPTVESPEVIPEDSPLRRLLSPGKPRSKVPDPPAAPAEPPAR